MSTRRRGLVAAMEDLDEAVVAQINDTTGTNDPEVLEPQPDQPETEIIVFPEAGESPEAAEAEVQEAETEVEDVEDQITEAGDVAEQLENTADIVERSAENGGLDQSGAELLNATLEGLYDRVGLRINGKIMPSIESFGGLSSRMRSTRVSVEEIREQAKKIWQQILAALKVFWEQVKAFFVQLFNQAERYKARIANLRETASKVPDVANRGTFDDPKIARNLAIGRTLSVNLPSLIQKATAVSDSTLSFMDAMTEEIKASYLSAMKIPTQGDDLQAVMKSNTEAFLKSFTDIAAKTPLFGKTDGARMVSETLPGNKRFVTESSARSGLADKVGVGAKFRLKASVETVLDDVVPAVKVLTKAEATAALDAAEALLNSVFKFKEKGDKVSGTVAEINGAVMSLRSMTAKDDATQNAVLSTVSQATTNVVGYITTVPRLITRYDLSVVGAALSYVEKSFQKSVEVPEGNNNTPKLAAA